MFCNCKEITSTYSAIIECSCFIAGLANLGNIVKMFGRNFEKACDM